MDDLRADGNSVIIVDHGRQVKRGEKGIRIIAPAPYKVKTEQPAGYPTTGISSAALREQSESVRKTCEYRRQYL